MMKILIIGGTGVISTSITHELLEQGDEVTLYNRGKTQSWMPLDPRAKVMHGDRNDFAAFEQQMTDAGHFDTIIDMICFASEQAESAIRAFKGRTGQFIFCSTVDVYRKPSLRFPVREDEARIAASDYGRNKVRCEDLFFDAGNRGDFAVTILRPAHTYSEVGSVVHTFGWGTDFLDRLRRGKPVIVHGDGQSLWVSCHADDVGHAFVMACGNAKTYGKAYHMTGEEWQCWDVYHRAVAEAIGAPPPTLIHVPTELLYRLAPEQIQVTLENFQYTNILDNSAAKNDLDFHYTIDWKSGVKRMYDWLNEHGRIIDSDTEPYYDHIITAWQQFTTQLTTSFTQTGPAN